MEILESIFHSSFIARKINTYETGMEINLQSVKGNIFSCFKVKEETSGGSYVEKKQQYLLIEDNKIIELDPTSSISKAKVTDVHHLEGLSTIKFKKNKNGAIILVFYTGKKLSFLMKHPELCVKAINEKMKHLGINGINNKANKKSFFDQAKDIESKFYDNPSIDLVQEMMDILRKSVESISTNIKSSKSEPTNSKKEELDKAIKYMKNFLQREDVIFVLDSMSSSGTEKGNQQKQLFSSFNLDGNSISSVSDASNHNGIELESNNIKSETNSESHNDDSNALYSGINANNVSFYSDASLLSYESLESDIVYPDEEQYIESIRKGMDDLEITDGEYNEVEQDLDSNMSSSFEVLDISKEIEEMQRTIDQAFIDIKNPTYNAN